MTYLALIAAWTAVACVVALAIGRCIPRSRKIAPNLDHVSYTGHDGGGTR